MQEEASKFERNKSIARGKKLCDVLEKTNTYLLPIKP